MILKTSQSHSLKSLHDHGSSAGGVCQDKSERSQSMIMAGSATNECGQIHHDHGTTAPGGWQNRPENSSAIFTPWATFPPGRGGKSESSPAMIMVRSPTNECGQIHHDHGRAGAGAGVIMALRHRGIQIAMITLGCGRRPVSRRGAAGGRAGTNDCGNVAIDWLATVSRAIAYAPSLTSSPRIH